ncbi:MAG TPA: restriction endonuclease subunit S, partial [Ktedonobacteraceae bacterium]|nr:restriction endonuclease subunit S [Ktedonobacteraceae bacterium]
MVITVQNIHNKPGYKQTEIGMIPEDWEVEKLGGCLLGTPQYGINAPAIQYADGLPIYLRITDITDDGYFSPENITSVRNVSGDKYILKADDLVFARTGASVGKTYLYRPEDGILVFAGYLIRVKVNPSKLLPGYLAAYIKTGHYWSWVSAMSMRSGQPGINSTEYAHLPIPLPPLSEQQAIATALSDVDALIASLDKLIAKKRDIKQATMQQLLTGKLRLPGFSGEWRIKRIEEIAPLQRGFDLPASHLKEGVYPVVYSNGVLYHHSSYKVKAPGVITGRSGTIGKVNYVEDDYWPHNTTLWVTDFKGNLPKFIYYLYMNMKLERFGTGSGV